MDQEKQDEKIANGGWFRDPTGRHQFRFFDGNQWTSEVSTNGLTGDDPIRDETFAVPKLSSENEFYRSTWFIIFSLVLCFPLGLPLMWIYKKWHIGFKITVTCIFVGLLLIGVLAPDPPPNYRIVVRDTIETNDPTYSLAVEIEGTEKTINVTINGEIASRNGDEYARIVELEPGENTFDIEAKYKKEVRSKTVLIYLDENMKSGGDISTNTQPETPEGPKTSFDDGTYLVNSEIEPGQYKTEGDGRGCYWERLSGTSGAFGDIIANGFAEGQTIVTIKAGDFAFKSSGCNEWNKI